MSGKKVKTKDKGITLLELLLTIAIVGIVGLVIFQSTSYSMNVFRRTNSTVNLEIIKIMQQLSRDLRSAFLISKKHPRISFSGTNSSVKFISIASLNHDFGESNGFDLKEKRYYLIPGQNNQARTLMYSIKNIYSQNVSAGKEGAEDGDERSLSSSIGFLDFAYFDGRKWLPSWNSLEQLPRSVRITIQFQKNGQKNLSEYFSTVIRVPST